MYTRNILGIPSLALSLSNTPNGSFITACCFMPEQIVGGSETGSWTLQKQTRRCEKKEKREKDENKKAT